jgi:SAM-dependent methyltransferase
MFGVVACAPSLDAQRATAAAAAADTLKFPAPDRPVSRIVAPRWTAEDERDRFGEAAKVIALAGVREGMTVADIGAGDGYYVTRLSPIVGPTGRVLGEDIMPAYVDLLRTRAESENLTNVRAVLGTPDDPKLAARSVDVAFMIHMYHEITRPFELLWNLSRAMKPAATLAILDQDGPTDRHGTPPALLRCELGVLGYEQTRRVTLDDGAYVVLFRAPGEPVAPAVVRERLAAGACKQGR